TTASAERALETAGERYADRLASLLGETERTFSEATGASRRKRLLRQREILTTLTTLGARQLHAHELAAIFAFRHGFTPELHQLLNDARSLNVRRSIVVGSIFDILNATKRGVLKQIHDLLLEEKKPLTGSEIAKRLKIHKNISISSLAVLDHMGLVRKLPVNYEKEQVMTFPYIHEEHALNSETKHLTIPTWNYAFRILKMLHERGGSAKVPDLHRSGTIMGAPFGNPDSTLTRQSVLSNVRKLEQVGLIKLSRVSRKRGGADKLLHLTENASRLIADTIENRELPEELRILLLGQARRKSELPLSHQNTYARMVTWLEILPEITNAPRASSSDGATAIARKLGISRATVRTVMSGKTPFFGKFSLSTIRKIYLPKLREERPELVPVLESYLAARGWALGEKAFTKKSKVAKN
ncbi:MAG: hypothetical protein V1644_02360, partial [Candidatus Micrarchaeota archaeon]